jgi:hypothetical protein
MSRFSDPSSWAEYIWRGGVNDAWYDYVVRVGLTIPHVVMSSMNATSRIIALTWCGLFLKGL